ERGGLPGPGLRLREEVTARAKDRNGLGLHRCRRHEAELVDRFRDVRMDLELAEGCGLFHSRVWLIRLQVSRDMLGPCPDRSASRASSASTSACTSPGC